MILSMFGADRGTTNPTKVGFITGAAIPTPTEPAANVLPGAPGALLTPDTTDLAPAATGRPLRGFADLFYFRIWMLPRILDAQNPKVGVPIPFQIWNAYLKPNELQGLNAIDATGVTLDLLPGEILPALALRTVNALIDEDAPNTIDATFEFDFALGSSALRFLAILADILPIEPSDGIVEVLEWKTNILQNYDGSEQRIALRPRPRRSFLVELRLNDDADRKKLYDKLYKTAALTIIAPSYQYQSRLKVKTVPGDNKLYTNVRRADLRVGENVLIVTKDGEFYLYEIEGVFADHVTIATAFSQALQKGSIVSGAFRGRFPNKSGLAMANRGGRAKLSIKLEDSRDQVAWPDSGVSVLTFSGKPLLLRNPLADGETNEAFDVGLDVIDNETGKPAYYSSFTQPFVEGTRQYLVQSLFDQDDLEYWRTFLDLVRGQQKAFYTPTYRHDLKRVVEADFLQTKITIEGNDYSQFFASPSYRQLQLETSVGTYQVAIESIEADGLNTVLNFVDPIPVDVSAATVERISYLMLVRLGQDTVSLTHRNSYSIVDLNLRMAVA